MPERMYTYWHPEKTCWGPYTSERCQFAEVMFGLSCVRCLHSEVPDDTTLDVKQNFMGGAKQPEWCPARKDPLRGTK